MSSGSYYKWTGPSRSGMANPMADIPGCGAPHCRSHLPNRKRRDRPAASLHPYAGPSRRDTGKLGASDALSAA